MKKSNGTLNPTDLANIFKNINFKPCNSPGYDYAFDITENEKFIGELYYSTENNEWAFIKDNFPHRRRSYNISFPIKSVELFIELFDSIGVSLHKSV